MNEPIIVKGLKNPDGTVISKFFGKVPVDFIAIRAIDEVNIPIYGLDDFKMAGMLKGVLEERNTLHQLVSSHSAALYVGFDPTTNTVTQWLQTNDTIYTRKFENNAWGLWEEDSLMTLNKMRFFAAKHNLSDGTIIGLDDYKDYGLFVGHVNVYGYHHGQEHLLYHVGAILYVKAKGENLISQFLQINKDIYTRDFDNETETWGTWTKNTLSVEGHTHVISDITGLQDALDGKSPLEHTYFEVGDDVAAVECNPLGSGVPGAYMYAANGDYLSAIKLSIVDGKAYVNIDGDYVFGNAIVNNLADSDDDEEKLPTTGAVVTALAGKASTEDLEGVTTALTGKSDIGHEHTMGDVNGLIGALADKANASDLANKQNSTDNNLETRDKTIVGAINEIHASHGTVIEFDASAGGQLELSDQTPFGQMYHIDNSLLSSPLNQIITTAEGGDNVHYHQNAGGTIADHFMIRVYRYDADYFVEIAGAWDNIIPPQE